MNNIHINSRIHDFAHLGNALAVHNVKLCDLERRSNLVLDNLNLCVVTDYLAANLNGLDSSYVKSNRSIELKSTAARCGLGVTVHNSDFLTNLVDENSNAVRLGDCTCKLFIACDISLA